MDGTKSSDCASQFLAWFHKSSSCTMVLANAQGILHFSPSCPDYYFTHIVLQHGEISYSCKLQPTISAVFCWYLVMHSDMYTWNTLSLLYIPGEPLCYGAHVCPGRPACCSGTRSCPGCTRRPHWQCSGPVALPAACSTADAPTQLREEMQWCKQLPLMIPQCSSQHCFLLSNIDGTRILLLGIMKCRGSSVYDNALRYDLLKSHFKW